jgi:hypothetical protein
MVHFPGIPLTALVQAWRCNDVATIAAYVETITKSFDAIGDVYARMDKEVVHATIARKLGDGFGKLAVGALQVDTADVATFVAVLIQHDQTGG